MLIALIPLLFGQSPAPNRVIDLVRQPGTHAVVARVGDALRFDTTYGQSASTGYSWRGPRQTGDAVLGKITTQFKKVKDYDRLKKLADAQAPMPGRPEANLGTHYVVMPVVKSGQTALTFVFTRLGIDAPRQPDDKICTYRVTVRSR